VGDLRATLDELERMNSAGRFQQRLALGRIGLLGRSFGGATTLVGLAMEQRFTSGFAVVPLAVADQRPLLPPEVLVPTGQDSALLAAEGPSPFIELAKPTFLLSGAEDALIISTGRDQAKMAGTEMPSPENPHPALRQSFQDSKQMVIWGLLADSNHATLGISGGYWWPALKSDTAQRAFAADTAFKLIDPTVAHRIQREKALAFFDLTLRGDTAARKALLDDGYADQGLTLEARNMRGN
jgi:dienelactone hydrolase